MCRAICLYPKLWFDSLIDFLANLAPVSNKHQHCNATLADSWQGEGIQNPVCSKVLDANQRPANSMSEPLKPTFPAEAQSEVDLIPHSSLMVPPCRRRSQKWSSLPPQTVEPPERLNTSDENDEEIQITRPRCFDAREPRCCASLPHGATLFQSLCL